MANLDESGKWETFPCGMNSDSVSPILTVGVESPGCLLVHVHVHAEPFHQIIVYCCQTFPLILLICACQIMSNHVKSCTHGFLIFALYCGLWHLFSAESGFSLLNSGADQD